MAELEKKICILYVDDELPNLVAFHANFRRDYEIHIAESADKAFELLQTIEPHIVISDQRMPGMTGVDFYLSGSHPHFTHRIHQFSNGDRRG